MRKVTVLLNEQAFTALDGEARDSGNTQTNVINRALLVYALTQNTIREGGTLHARKPDGAVQQLHIS
jgi:hypothetical protein